MMKRSMLMIALVLAWSTVQAVKRQETISPAQENTLRREAKAKIEAIKGATTFAELNNLKQAALAAINKVPGHKRDLNAFHAATVTGADNILKTQAAKTPDIFKLIKNNARAVLDGLIVDPATDPEGLVLEDGTKISYDHIINHVGNDAEWKELMRLLPEYAKVVAEGINVIIERFFKNMSKDEVANLKANKHLVMAGEDIVFDNIQGLLRQFYIQGNRHFIDPAKNIADAAKKAEFERAIRPITTILEKFRKVLTDKGFTL